MPNRHKPGATPACVKPANVTLHLCQRQPPNLQSGQRFDADPGPEPFDMQHECRRHAEAAKKLPFATISSKFEQPRLIRLLPLHYGSNLPTACAHQKTQCSRRRSRTSLTASATRKKSCERPRKRLLNEPGLSYLSTKALCSSARHDAIRRTAIARHL